MEKKPYVIETQKTFEKLNNPALTAEKLLTEISELYLARCKVLQGGDKIALELFNHKIDQLRARLEKL